MRASVIADLDAQRPVAELDHQLDRTLSAGGAMEHAVGHQLRNDQRCIARPPAHISLELCE
jgi:hypothetical protein